MQKVSKMLKRAYRFLKRKVKKKDLIISGKDFPDEYVRKILKKEDLTFSIRRGLYLLKNKGEDAENLVYRFYWQIVEKLLKIYTPWSIEKESALVLHLGVESIPQKLSVRTLRKVKYFFSLPFDLRIQIRPDPLFHEKTRQRIEIGRAKIFVDVPEKVLFSIRKRKGINFNAFLRGVDLNKKMLEVLYWEKPKSIVIKELIRNADKVGRHNLSLWLKEIFKKYTIYRT